MSAEPTYIRSNYLRFLFSFHKGEYKAVQMRSTTQASTIESNLTQCICCFFFYKYTLNLYSRMFLASTQIKWGYVRLKRLPNQFCRLIRSFFVVFFLSCFSANLSTTTIRHTFENFRNQSSLKNISFTNIHHFLTSSETYNRRLCRHKRLKLYSSLC